MQNANSHNIDPFAVKELLVDAEDTRIATKLSEMSCRVIDEKVRSHRENQIRGVHLNLRTGQQCVRDFFLCLNENMLEWPDVYSKFSFDLVHSTICSSCEEENSYETNQMYVELPVPPDNTILKDHVEKYLNEATIIKVSCDGCKRESEKKQKVEIDDCDEVQFLIIILSRGRTTLTGYEFSSNRVNVTEDILIR